MESQKQKPQRINSRFWRFWSRKDRRTLASQRKKKARKGTFAHNDRESATSPKRRPERQKARRLMQRESRKANR